MQKHNGVDYGAPEGTPVYAIAEGTVTGSGFDNSRGNYVIIKHANGLSSHYFHLSKIDITRGRVVNAGQKIGEVGNTGMSEGAHLHLGIDSNGTWQNPEIVMGRASASPQLSANQMQKFSGQVDEARKLFI